MAENSKERDKSAWHAVSERTLIEGLRSARGEAVDEFVRRFEPLATRRARRLRIPPAERAQWVIELLFDVASTIGRRRTAAPRHLGAYVAGACRRHVHEQLAREESYHAHVEDALTEIGGLAETTVPGLCSESSLRAARDPNWEDPPPLPPVLLRLTSAFHEGVTDE